MRPARGLSPGARTIDHIPPSTSRRAAAARSTSQADAFLSSASRPAPSGTASCGAGRSGIGRGSPIRAFPAHRRSSRWPTCRDCRSATARPANSRDWPISPPSEAEAYSQSVDRSSSPLSISLRGKLTPRELSSIDSGQPVPGGWKSVVRTCSTTWSDVWDTRRAYSYRSASIGSGRAVYTFTPMIRAPQRQAPPQMTRGRRLSGAPFDQSASRSRTQQ